MTLLVSLTKLQKLCPNTPFATLELYVDALNTILDAYAISQTKTRLCMFLAQVAHESGEFRFFKENLNYSAQSLRKVFAKYFPNDNLANAYARNPQKIANRVYANRMGNGNEASGDGWAFRGRGLIQLTGRNNYTLLGKGLNMTPEQVATYLETPEGAVIGAAWFWQQRNLNAIADTNNFTKITQLINGGQNGADHRLQLYNRALSIF